MSCKDCTKRVIGCHSSCEAYKLYREKIEIRQQNRIRHYMTPRAGFEINLKNKVRNKKSLGHMKIN